ncbi:MAG: P-loop NTPase fold protein [Minisyncoccia bacterium]
MTTDKCFITSLPVKNIPSNIDAYEYLLNFNDREFTLRYDGRADWNTIIKGDAKIVLQSMLFNNRWPIDTDSVITPELVERTLRIVKHPKEFEDKVSYYLEYAYEAGGKEYNAVIYKLSDYEIAYSKDENEFTRIIQALISKQFISLLPAHSSSVKAEGSFELLEPGRDMVKNIQSKRQPKIITITPTGKKIIKKIHLPLNERPSIHICFVESDKPIAEKLRDLFLENSFTTSLTEIKEETLAYSSVFNLRDSIEQRKSNYFVFVKSHSSDINNGIGSAIDIAIATHRNSPDKARFIYIASADDSKYSTRPLLEDYLKQFFDIRILDERERMLLDIFSDWKTRQNKILPAEKLTSTVLLLKWLWKIFTVSQKNPITITYSQIKEFISSEEQLKSFLSELENQQLITMQLYDGLDVDQYRYEITLMNNIPDWLSREISNIEQSNAGKLKSINESNKVYNFPKVSLTDNELFWLKISYEKFLKNETFNLHEELAKHWDKLPKDFDPSQIDQRLLIGGYTITLLGIWHVNPSSEIFGNTDKTIFIIRELLIEKSNRNVITSKDIQAKNSALTNDDILKSITILSQFRGFMHQHGHNPETFESNISIRDGSSYDKFRQYNGIEELVNEFFKKNKSQYSDSNETNQSTKEFKLKNIVDSLNLNDRAFQKKSQVSLRDKTQIDTILGVKEIAKEIAEIIDIMPNEKGMMMGIFGKWGRGKTVFMSQIWENLKEIKLKNEVQYERVDFHAWQYQETPASWAYLYERLAEKYYKKPEKIFTKDWWEYWNRIIKLNIKRQGYTPIIKSISVILFALSITIGGIAQWEWVFALIGIPMVGSALIVILSKFKKEYSTKAFDLIKKYGLKHSYKDTMGIQAEIQKEVVHLVKTWIPVVKVEKGSSDEKYKKIILFVEDVDRCAEEKIIQNIDALRIMLEDEEVAKRVIVIAAIDEQVLKRAIKAKYFKLLDCENYSNGAGTNKFDELAKLTNEYLDKLFITGIKLGTLSAEQRDEFVVELTKHDRQNLSVKKLYEDEFPSARSENNDQLDFATIDGDLVFKDGDIALENQKGEIKIIEQIQKNKTVTLENSTETVAFEKLTDGEISILRGCVNDWDEATPRKIRIFYYRYLIAKNLLLNRYQKLSWKNIWLHPKYSSVFAQLIIKYGELYNPSLITEHRLRTNTLPLNEVVKIDMFGDFTVKNQDYIEMLKILEMVIAY